MKIGELIKRRRNSLKLTREALAIKAKVSEKSLYNYEEDLQSPSVLSLLKIAKAMQLTLSQLVDDHFSVHHQPSEDEVVEQIFALHHRKDIGTFGVIRIISKVLHKIGGLHK
jgi:transcriptional regulator with XRE-family HTH domain